MASVLREMKEASVLWESVLREMKGRACIEGGERVVGGEGGERESRRRD
jgi:hypothetical protein